MKINYNVEVEARTVGRGPQSEEAIAIDNFFGSENNNMVLEYDTEEEAKARASVVANRIKKINTDENKKVLQYAKRGAKIYVTRIADVSVEAKTEVAVSDTAVTEEKSAKPGRKSKEDK